MCCSVETRTRAVSVAYCFSKAIPIAGPLGSPCHHLSVSPPTNFGAPHQSRQQVHFACGQPLRDPRVPDTLVEVRPAPPARVQSLAVSDTAPPFENFTRGSVSRQTSDNVNKSFKLIRQLQEPILMHLSGHSTSFACRCVGHSLVSDYLATSTSIVGPVSFLDDEIDCLNKCIERVVAAKIASCTITPQSASSRPSLEQ